MILVRVLMGAAVLALTTMAGFPTIGPVVVGAACALVWGVRGVPVAAFSALLGWGGLLLMPLLRGQPVAAVAEKVGAVMGVSGTGLVSVTLLYAVVLATAAAYPVAQFRRAGHREAR